MVMRSYAASRRCALTSFELAFSPWDLFRTGGLVIQSLYPWLTLLVTPGMDKRIYVIRFYALCPIDWQ